MTKTRRPATNATSMKRIFVVMLFSFVLSSCAVVSTMQQSKIARDKAAAEKIATEKAHTEELYERAMKKQLTKAEERVLCERIIKGRIKKGLDVTDIDGCLAQLETRRAKRAEMEKAAEIERLKDSACYDLALIKKQQGYIKHQKEVARMSGFVNKKIMYDAAAGIIQDRKGLKEKKKRYKQLTGKNIDLSDCPK